MKILEEELGAPLESFFSYISEEPVAAASFGQVLFCNDNIIKYYWIGCMWLHLFISIGMMVYVLLTYLITFSRFTLPVLLTVLMLL